MNARTVGVATLLFGSGACALVYQMAWLREFRLVFGASTEASAAVLGIFMAGLGLGSWVLGRRADRQINPLRFYSLLEFSIAGSAAVTPLLLWLIRVVYIATGGSPVLGTAGATMVRLLLASLALLIPTVLMGGTLPAAARSIATGDDDRRRGVAILYGVNTLGAVTGSVLATFFLVETLGNRRTLWAACLVNALVAFFAYTASRKIGDHEEKQGAAIPLAQLAPTQDKPRKALAKDSAADVAASTAPAPFVLFAALAVGFAFLLMELVWYRMLGPILGGSTYTFGLILAVALLGIGLGGAAYGLGRAGRPATLNGFALTCALEALFIALPYALGDRVALLSLALRSLGSFGFYGLVLAWLAVTAIVVLPAAFMSGVQFPLLIALLGRGGKNIGRQIGQAYSYNTIGAILGSLAGGFGLLPVMGATGAWIAVVIILALLAVAALLLELTRHRSTAQALAWPAGVIVVSLLLLLSTGPTMAWRQGGIGAGRSDAFVQSTPNGLQQFLNSHRRPVVWQAEGIESSVAVVALDGYAFWVNGKSDGHARRDAGTQIMSGLIGAVLHPDPKKSMVIGLGTGSTAGWLAATPTMERVDVVELEPAITHVADMCAPVNQDVLRNPKLHLSYGDAREALLTTRQRYDLIFSEPSNPYRAGIASLYTHEFYEAVRQRLELGGTFIQWVQAYEVDGQTIRTIITTLAQTFPEISTWQTQTGDLVLLASAAPIDFNVPHLRARIAQEPYHGALAYAWRVTDLEGFLAHHVMSASMARLIAQTELQLWGGPAGALNTDDRQLVEFAFARSVGSSGSYQGDVISLAQQYDALRPATTGGAVDWSSVEDQRINMLFVDSQTPTLPAGMASERALRAQAMTEFRTGRFTQVLATWSRQPKHASNLMEWLAIGQSLASQGNEQALPYIELIRRTHPGEADALLADLRWAQVRAADAMTALENSFAQYQRQPWADREVMTRAIVLAGAIAQADPFGDVANRLYLALSKPFSVHMLNDLRRRQLAGIADRVDQLKGTNLAAAVVSDLEPDVPWDREYLTLRRNVYKRVGDPRAIAAEADLDLFTAHERLPIRRGLPDPAPASAPSTEPATQASTQPGQ